MWLMLHRIILNSTKKTTSFEVVFYFYTSEILISTTAK